MNTKKALTFGIHKNVLKELTIKCFLQYLFAENCKIKM